MFEVHMAKVIVYKVPLIVAEYKIKHSLPIYDEKREQEVINKNLQYIEDNEIKEYYIDFLTEVMNISKKYQEKIIKKNLKHLLVQFFIMY